MKNKPFLLLIIGCFGIIICLSGGCNAVDDDKEATGIIVGKMVASGNAANVIVKFTNPRTSLTNTQLITTTNNAGEFEIEVPVDSYNIFACFSQDEANRTGYARTSATVTRNVTTDLGIVQMLNQVCPDNFYR